MPPPDRELRRLVAELATATPEDVEEVLADLAPGHGSRVRALLADYLGEAAPAAPVAAAAEPPPRPADVSHLSGLSPWLGVRLARSVEPGLGISGRRRDTRAEAREPFMSFSMTPTALAALQSAARELQPLKARAPAAAPPSAGWRARLAHLVGRGR